MTGRYKAYSEYKDSGVDWFGDIPSAWKFLPLKRNFKIVNGSTPRSSEASFWDGDITWVTPADLSKVDVHISGSSKNITNKGLSSCGTSLVPKGSLILSTRAPIGTIAIASKELCTNQGCKSLVLYNNVDSKFYYYVISVSGKQLNNLGRGTTFLELSTDELSNFAVPTPSFAEQHKIVSFLDHETAKIDTLIAKQEKLIELLKEKRQAVISHAVTKGLNPDAPMKGSGVEWLGEVPEHWTVGRVKNLAKLISKGTTPSTIGGDFIDEGIRFLKGENIGKSLFVNPSPTFYISEEVDAQLSRSRLQENDVLVIIAGATTGKASILTKDLLPANTNQAVSFIRPKKAIYSKLITLWLSTEFAQRIIWMGAVQAAQPNLSMENLGNLPIVLPDEDEIASLLNEIDKKVEQFDALIIKANSAIELMKERKIALISAAVTGKIDVRDWELK
ncbi:TPA: hypothetical protein GRI66_15440 [Vibrio parahaemolyticus]|nr:restriction endonuclease subunit S [Vibrio parahaemolyticus]MBE3780620.1 hypothetical protein [Vibrio parahaemolyticus]HAS6433052.1 hypothetical protein [Vibrio parahaemolyticus]HAS6852369.1 hypothetical protein [Vibrio parahaemolyticus]HAS6960543.1 hypothetical protein [Vibrio parahaemolyticus]